jgi:hypothetical protein
LPKGLFYLNLRAVFSSARESCIIIFAGSVRIKKHPITKQECETFLSIVDHFVSFLVEFLFSAESAHRPIFYVGIFHAEGGEFRWQS